MVLPSEWKRDMLATGCRPPHTLTKLLTWRSSPSSAGRLSSNFFPWGGKYKIEDLPTYEGIKEALARAGQVRYWTVGCHQIPLEVRCSPSHIPRRTEAFAAS